MNHRLRTLQLCGVSALALVALGSTNAFACTGSASSGNPAVIVNCTPGTSVGAFTTQYGNGDNIPIYDGNQADTITIGDGAIITRTGTATPLIAYTNESFTTNVPLNASATGEIELLGGSDTFDMTGGTIGATGATVNVRLGAGNDNFSMLGGVIYGAVYGDGGNDTIEVGGTAVINGDVLLDGGEVAGSPNTFRMTGGTINGSVIGGGGNDTITVGNGTISSAIYGNAGNDGITINAGAVVSGQTGSATLTDAVGLGDGDDTFVMNGGTLGSAGAPGLDVSGGAGADRIELNGGTVFGDLLGNEGNDTIVVRGGSVGEEVRGNEGNDQITIAGGSVAQNVNGDDGDDSITVSGGAIAGNVEGGAGNDRIGISGGTIGGSVIGGDGLDSVTMSGGTVNGNIQSEEVTLTGGRLVGNVSGITANTLVIQDNGTLVLSNGVTFAGTGAANGTVTNSDLAKGGGQSQVFTGFANLSAFGSTLSFAGSSIGIAQLNLSNGSTLFVNGNVNLSGVLNLTGSTLDMLNGAATDVFTLGGLVLNGSNIRLDFNQQTLQADRLNAGAFTASGVNTIVVNLLGTPNFTSPTDIVLIQAGGGPVGGTFNIVTIPGTAGSLFGYQVLAAPGGGLILRATPGDFGVVANAQSVINNSTVDNAVQALYGIVDDAIVSDLALGNGSRSVAIGDSFGIFASGAFSQTNHDGYTIDSGAATTTKGAEFRADDFSAALSLDFNAAKHFGFDQQYGLNIGVFGGYASTDVTLGDYLGFTNVGDGLNKSGMFGGYTLFRKGTNYGLFAVSGFLGNTDVNNGVLNTTGSYGTEGYAVNGSVGRIFALSDRVRFDLRGGLMGVTFSGDGYTDSGGNVFGKSRVKFGAVKFEPGIYADYKLSNGMIFSPYARGELQQRFGYENTATIAGREISFDDADFSAAASAGFNLRMSERATLSSEIRGKVSEDSNTFGGKLGFKVGF